MPRKRWPPSAVLNTAQAAHHIGVKPGTLAKARTYGGSPPWTRPIGKAVRYLVKDLDAWLEERRTGHGSPCRDCPHHRRDR